MINQNILENILHNLAEITTILEGWKTKSIVFEEQKNVASKLSQALSDIWMLESTETLSDGLSADEIKSFNEQKDILRKALSDLREELNKEDTISEEPILEKVEEPEKIEEEEEFEFSETIPEKNLPPQTPKETTENYTTSAIIDVFSVHDEDEPALATPISSIAETIGIIDKFLFIKELFDNNENHFKQAVEQLDNMANLEQAQTYMATLFTNIDKKNNYALKQFGSLVARRYMNR